MTDPGDFCGFDRTNHVKPLSGVKNAKGEFEPLDWEEVREKTIAALEVREQPRRRSWLERFVRNLVSFRWGVRL